MALLKIKRDFDMGMREEEKTDDLTMLQKTCKDDTVGLYPTDSYYLFIP